MLTITQLEYILAVDVSKHFGKAAKACNVSQPSLSAQIQKAEEMLGVILFDRSKQPIITTQVGLLIVSQAKLIIKEHRKLQSIINEESEEPSGEFHLAVIPTLAPYVLPLFLKEFSNDYPKVKLTIHESKTEDIIRDLSNDKIDAGLLVTPLYDEAIIERHLFFEPFYAFVSKDHPLSKRKIISEKDLENFDLWLLAQGHCLRDQVLKVCSLGQNKNVLPNVEFESGNLETLINLVRKKSGYTLIPELALSHITAKDRSEYVKKFKSPIPTREVSLVHSRSFLKESIIEALEKSILDNLPRKIKSLKKSQTAVIDI